MTCGAKHEDPVLSHLVERWEHEDGGTSALYLNKSRSRIVIVHRNKIVGQFTPEGWAKTKELADKARAFAQEVQDRDG